MKYQLIFLGLAAVAVFSCALNPTTCLGNVLAYEALACVGLTFWVTADRDRDDAARTKTARAAEALAGDVCSGKKTINQARAGLGLPPYEVPMADQLMKVTAEGVVPVQKPAE